MVGYRKVILVEAWSEDAIRKLLFGSKAFQNIVEVLADHDYERTVKQ